MKLYHMTGHEVGMITYVAYKFLRDPHPGNFGRTKNRKFGPISENFRLSPQISSDRDIKIGNKPDRQ